MQLKRWVLSWVPLTKLSETRTENAVYSKSEQFRAVFSIDDQQSPFLDLYDDVERQQTSPRDPQKNIALCLAANSREKLQSAVEFMLPAGAYSRCP